MNDLDPIKGIVYSSLGILPFWIVGLWFFLG
jgi:hypothetical protein